MDALPIVETSGKAWSSQVLGKMHACGHDGHTAMLLAAARHLAATRNFDGIVHLVFQPAEEGQAGARKMLEDGFLDLFPCEAMFGMHNMPGKPAGKFVAVPGFAMASSDSVIIKVRGKGGHGAMPQAAIDTVVGGVQHRDGAADRRLTQRAAAGDGHRHRRRLPRRRGAQRDPRDGRAAAVGARLPPRCAGPAGAPHHRDRPRPGRRLRRHGRGRLPAPLPGAAQRPGKQTEFCKQVVRDWLGDEGMLDITEPVTGSEDFAFFLEKVPGCYVFIGNGEGSEGGCMVHNPGYDFNDRVLPTGASYWVRLAESYLKKAG
jgi:hippurate hydrolase